MMSAPIIAIREAVAEDESDLSTLDMEARSEGARHRGSRHLFDSLGPFSDRWAGRGTSHGFDVAVVRELVVGFVVVRHGERPLLDQVFVLPQARGLGVGSNLLKDAVSRHGAENLDALSLPGDRLTKNLYERSGLKARLIIASSL